MSFVVLADNNFNNNNFNIHEDLPILDDPADNNVVVELQTWTPSE